MLYRLRVNDFILKLSSFFINIGHPYTFVIFRGVHITEFLVTFFFPFYFILRGITLVDEVHDFVDVLIGEVFFAKAGVISERQMVRGEQTAQNAATFQPVPQVFKKPPDAGPK